MQPSVRVKITDFGLAKRLSNRKTTALVTKGIGTAGYKAPEVVELWYSEDPNRHLNHFSRRSYTFRADIWSLGCVVVRMFVGEDNRLFHSDTELMDKRRLRQQVRSIGKILERGTNHIGPEGIRFIQRLVVIREKDRYDAESALEALEKWTVSETT
ncbi:hypothetical protein F4811DRAFT_516233 [Daldinia bambusicola]|nr:hypothetical protein F4811DRAFT_516233 [Daldinia bambusicola]